MRRSKNSYHPLFIVQFMFNLLPHEVMEQIPRSTQRDWNHKNLENCVGAQHCALYTKHFNDVAYAHKYRFARYVLSAAIGIQKTMLAITNQHTYKKLLRTQKHAIVEHITELARKGFSVAQACKLFGLKTSWYHYHKRIINCPLNVLKTCFKQHPTQLTYAEQQAIKQWVQKAENKHKNLTQLYYEAINNNIVICSKNTFTFYAKQFGYQKPEPKPKPKREKGFRAAAIFQYLHVDTSYIPTVMDGILKFSLVKDNYSKAPLHYIITKMNVNSSIIKRVLEETFDKFNLFKRTHDIHIVSDGGPENKGEVLDWIGSLKAPPCVQKLTAYIEPFMHSNNMIESSFHLFKNDFLKGETVYTEQQLRKRADGFLHHCLHRYFSEHHGITPQQILDGATPNKHLFKEQIQQARKERLQANKNFTGCHMPGC